MFLRSSLGLWLVCAAATPAAAQDALRGAQLYLRLDAGVPSCVTCHGHDPTQGRNNMLRAADDPAALQKALNAVGPMGYLKSVLSPADVADLSAYLGRVRAAANPQGPVASWPSTMDFGRLSDGAASPEQRMTILNRESRSWRVEPRVEGTGFEFVNDCPALLAPGAACTVRLRARPPASGVAAGALVWSADTDWSPLVVGLAVDSVHLAVGALAPLQPAEFLRFEAQAVGGALEQEWPLINRGSAAVTLQAATVSGPQADQFTVAGNCAVGRTIPPGQGCALVVRHTAQVPGPALAALQLTGDGTTPAVLGLAGRGMAPPLTELPAPSTAGGGTVGWGWLAVLALAVVGLSRSPWPRRRNQS